jgi:hypothetical protein
MVGAKKLVFASGKFIQAMSMMTIPCGAPYIVPSMGRLLALLTNIRQIKGGVKTERVFPYYGKITKWKYYPRKNGSTIPGKIKIKKGKIGPA